MPTSHATWAQRASAVLVWLGASGVGLLSTVTRAQEGTPAGNPQAPPATQSPAATPGVTPAAPAAGSLGTILVESTPVRVWPTVNSPNFDETLRRGQVVGVGRSQGGFRQIVLPMGPCGFVNKKYASEPADGKVRTVGKAVSFRYRPKGGEAAVALLPEGVEMVVIGEQDDWWRVRHSGTETWLPEAEVQVFEQPPATMTLAYEELQKVHRAEAEAWLAKVAAAQEKARVEAANQKALLDLDTQFQAELRKPPASQQLEPLLTALTELEGKLAADSLVRDSLAGLRKRVKDQKWVADATALRDSEPPPAKDLPPPPAGDVPDGLERFSAIGWLRYEKPLTGPGQYVVEQGGQSLFVVTCSSRRYDLSVFVDREVGLIGPKRSPAGLSLRILDIEKIEVLNAGR